MEEWIRWEPMKGLEGKHYLSSFGWSEKGFMVELMNFAKGKKIQILFCWYVDAYRYTNESFNLKILDNASQKDDTNLYGNYSLFKVKNSEYLAWISDKSCTLSDNMNFIHFCILGGDEYIDIIAGYEPKVTIIDYDPNVKIITYTRQEFGLELKAKIKNKEDLVAIEGWFFGLYNKHIATIDDDFQEIFRDLISIENDLQFKLSYEKLNNFADRLIAGEQNINIWDQFKN